jgi:flagellar hook-basal body complex protein FliE
MKVEKFVLDNLAQNEAAKTGKAGSSSFSDVLKESISKVGELEKEANAQTEKLVNMDSQDVHDTMISVQKADLTFQMMMQIRNKIIDAYQEIMKIQV